MTDDQIQQILQTIATGWRVDDDRIRWFDPAKDGSPGFDWWPGDFCVHVRAHRHHDPSIDPRARIVIDTDLLTNVALESEAFQRRVESLKGQFISTYAFVYVLKPLFDQANDPTLERKLWLSSSGYVSPETIEGMPRLLYQATLLQPIAAQWLAGRAAELLEIGVPDETRPHSLRDAPLDDMLGVLADVYAPMGEEPSRFAGTGEFEDFAAKWGQQDTCFGMGEPAELTVETSFGKQSALIRCRTDEGHPQAGHGLWATLRLPYWGDEQWGATEAAGLNLMESRQWTGFPLLGSWHSQKEGDRYRPTFSLFVPNALYTPGLASCIALWFVDRARWVRRFRFPEATDVPMAKILKRRMAKWRRAEWPITRLWQRILGNERQWP